MFIEIDKDKDKRISYNEFLDGIPLLEAWGFDK